MLAVIVMAVASAAGAQKVDTIFADVGSTAVDGRVFKPHAARVKIYRGDSLVQQWTNELMVGDSAGRQVHRWVTTSERVELSPNRPLSVLCQTYDAITLAPLGFSSQVNNGAFTRVAVSGNRVTGSRRTAQDTTVIPIDLTIEKPGFYSGASDIVPVAAGLRTGQVIVAPLWSPNATKPDYRVFVVLGDTTINVEGTMVRSRKVEERRRSDGSLYAEWYLLRESPYMVYGEVLLPDGRRQRMTEVPIPTSK